jgi:hypothetical protein
MAGSFLFTLLENKGAIPKIKQSRGFRGHLNFNRTVAAGAPLGVHGTDTHLRGETALEEPLHRALLPSPAPTLVPDIRRDEFANLWHSVLKPELMVSLRSLKSMVS